MPQVLVDPADSFLQGCDAIGSEGDVPAGQGLAVGGYWGARASSVQAEGLVGVELPLDGRILPGGSPGTRTGGPGGAWTLVRRTRALRIRQDPSSV